MLKDNKFLQSLKVIYIIPITKWLDVNGNKKYNFALLGIDKNFILKPIYIKGWGRVSKNKNTIGITNVYYTVFDAYSSPADIQQAIYNHTGIKVHTKYLLDTVQADGGGNYGILENSEILRLIKEF